MDVENRLNFGRELLLQEFDLFDSAVGLDFAYEPHNGSNEILSIPVSGYLDVIFDGPAEKFKSLGFLYDVVWAAGWPGYYEVAID